MHEIPGVEYVYSISSPGQSLVIVRFLVGTPEEDALVKVYSKLYSNADRMPQGALAVAGQGALDRRCADSRTDVVGRDITTAISCGRWRTRSQHTIRQIPDVSETKVIGGQPRAMRVVLDSTKLAGLRLFARRRCRAAAGGERAHPGGRIRRGQSGDSRRRGQSVPRYTGPGGRGAWRGQRTARCTCATSPATLSTVRPSRRTMCYSAPPRRMPGRSSEGISRGDHHHRQAQRHQRHRHRERGAGACGRDERRDAARRRDRSRPRATTARPPRTNRTRC